MDTAAIEFRAGAYQRRRDSPLVNNPNVAYSAHCTDNIPQPPCTPPPANISQELFAMPPNVFGPSNYYYRVVVSGTVTAQ